MSEDLLGLIPEFNLIQDPVLREKCIKAWDEGMRRGGWKPGDLKEMAFTLLIPDCPVDFVEHTRAVTLTCVGVADVFEKIYGDRNPIHRDYLIAGALLHDVGKLLEYTRIEGRTVKSEFGGWLRHPFGGVILAAEQGLPSEVLHMIATHAKEGDLVHRSKEAIILYHADFTSFETLK
ncbi:MAG TPA: HD domain-containing protein [Anaerolineae bacterium]|jgi:putative nucleotidyltransferase with HDIG domain|nr:HD domain-containing protein [Anaerolineae bacterium]